MIRFLQSCCSSILIAKIPGLASLVVAPALACPLRALCSRRPSEVELVDEGSPDKFRLELEPFPVNAWVVRQRCRNTVIYQSPNNLLTVVKEKRGIPRYRSCHISHITGLLSAPSLVFALSSSHIQYQSTLPRPRSPNPSTNDPELRELLAVAYHTIPSHPRSSHPYLVPNPGGLTRRATTNSPPHPQPQPRPFKPTPTHPLYPIPRHQVTSPIIRPMQSQTLRVAHALLLTKSPILAIKPNYEILCPLSTPPPCLRTNIDKLNQSFHKIHNDHLPTRKSSALQPPPHPITRLPSRPITAWSARRAETVSLACDSRCPCIVANLGACEVIGC